MDKNISVIPLLCLLSLQTIADPGTASGRSALPDFVPYARESLGIRRAWSPAPDTVVLDIGMSVTETAANPEAYRIISTQDPRYAPDRFVRPVSAEVVTIKEAEGVKGSAFPSFFLSRVTLKTPEPLRTGTVYSILGQGVGTQMVTGAKTAATFTTGEPASERGDLDQAMIGLRRVVSMGNGTLMLELGPGFAPEVAASPDLFTVLRNGQPDPVVHMGRRTVIEAYLPVGWPFSAIPRHEWFLTLGTPLADGDRISVSIDPSVCAGLNKEELRFRETETHSPSIKVNQVAMLPNAPRKLAYLGRWFGQYPLAEEARVDASANLQAQFLQELGSGPAVAVETDGGPALYFETPPEFHLRDAETHEVLWSGAAELLHRSGAMDEGHFRIDHSGENVYGLDFSPFSTSGRYYLSVPGVGRSPDFDLTPGAAAQWFRAQALGVYHQRCGIALGPPYTDWHRIACHVDGVIPTTLSPRVGEHRLFQELPDHIDFSGQAAFVPPPELERLNRDPALVAYWPLNGDLRDVSGNGHHLTPVEAAPAFEEALKLMAPRNRAWGPTVAEKGNGGRIAHLPFSRENGVTFSLWARVTGDQKFDGILIGHPDTNVHRSRMQITAGWGVLRGFAGAGSEPAVLGRLPADPWRHVALVLSADGTRIRAFLDGQPVSSAPAGDGEFEEMPFVVAALSGDAQAGKFVDEVRVYDRALTPDELQVLARRWGEAAIAIDTRGGHHDAGDYNPRSHMEVARILMNAYEMTPGSFHDGQLSLPEKSNGLPDILDEAAWAMRLWPPLQAADGSVRGGTESDGDPNFIQTVELDPKGDYAMAADIKTTFEFAGTFAQAARIYRTLDREEDAGKMLERARRAYDWADGRSEPMARTPEHYAQWVMSPQAYAAAELLHTTGEKRFAEDFAKTAVWSSKPDADLDQHRLYDQKGAAWAYLKCPEDLTSPELRSHIQEAVLRRADEFIRLCDTQAYKFFRHPWAPITWGTGTYPNQIDPLVWAWQLTGEDRYLEWILSSVDYMLGANPLSLSFVTGMGERTIRAPLHNSRYRAQGEVASGLHAQGPNQRGEGYRVQEVFHPRLREDFAPLYTFADVHFAIAMDEGTIPSMARCMALFGLLQSVGELD